MSDLLRVPRPACDPDELDVTVGVVSAGRNARDECGIETAAISGYDRAGVTAP